MQESKKSIFAEIIVTADIKDVWDAWTTADGIKSFFAPDCKIELQPDGMYEIYFDLEAPEGERGGEGVRVMAIQHLKMFSFTWNAPTSLPEVRGQRTHVVIRFLPVVEGIKVSLYHDGWGTGGQWEQAFEYFQKAWTVIVLPRLKYRFDHGPIDWDSPPNPSDM